MLDRNRFRRLLPAVALCAALTSFVPARAQVASYSAGVEGSPALAPDPTTQGWTKTDPSGGQVTTMDVSPDGASGLNAWNIDDSVTFVGGRLHYGQLLTPQQIALGADRGWTLRQRMRMLAGPTISLFYEYATGQTAADDRYLLFFTVSGNDVIATDLLNGLTYTCPNGFDGNYHTFEIQKPAGATNLDARFLYDGMLLGILSRAASNGNAPDGGVHWGSGSSAGTGSANYNRVDFFIGSPVRLYCTAKSVLVCGLPTIDTFGIPEAGATAGFDVYAGPARQNRSGLLLYSTAGPGSFPFQGGTLCINPAPLRRTVPISSGGASPCGGEFRIDFNAFASGQLGGNPDPALAIPGTQVNTQWWGRDSVATGSFLSDAAEFVL